ncbi:MAG: hypothetical protein KBA95_12035 [Acidobacteria bacterium]|nr:hypothetical protein [Acidobacteriota bacterium]
MSYLNTAAGQAREAGAATELDTVLDNIPQAAEADLTAITGGENPTEAEHNAVIAKVNALLAKLRTAGIISA